MKANILEAIGETPLVRINRLHTNPQVTLAVKLEGNNPGGSVKDRIAYYMLRKAEEKGELTKNKIILEPTSGNTGIGLAMAASVMGYRLVVTMSEKMSSERRKMLEVFGAELVLTPGELGTDGAIMKAREMIAKDPDRYYMPNQFANENNYMVHYETTAEEIWRQTDNKVTHFVAGMGTTGTLMGASRRLKELNPDIKIIGVEPYMNHKIQGLKNMEEAIKPAIYDSKRLDEKINVSDEDAFEMAFRLTREEGIFAGISAGAAMHAAISVANKLTSGFVVAIIPDRGDKYMSTDLFCAERCKRRRPDCLLTENLF
ncbi:PLP-dependent cysteine synthase family protein [Dethiobacter alkaliphilus]|uniref:cysteine synthase n=1 Tax=Dethiobacter alkaliphilus AHT 1 TaxID=555088 RepID=C0GC27_DETAL|nr:cysteine synthase [Dethiobacter alkaliphilus]EEG78762.1 cysteine synthase [Dethiobacter alkaliphilus AHT 1]